VPPNRRAWLVFIDECHCERVRFDACPIGDSGAKGQKEGRQRWSCAIRLIVGRAEERHAPTRDNTAHFEVRELDPPDRVRERRLFAGRNKIVSILEATWELSAE
jgi:hypothetical protein